MAGFRGVAPRLGWPVLARSAPRQLNFRSAATSSERSSPGRCQCRGAKSGARGARNGDGARGTQHDRVRVASTAGSLRHAGGVAGLKWRVGVVGASMLRMARVAGPQWRSGARMAGPHWRVGAVAASKWPMGRRRGAPVAGPHWRMIVRSGSSDLRNLSCGERALPLTRSTAVED